MAGGKGELALLLSLRGHACALVDPRPSAGYLSKKQRKQVPSLGTRTVYGASITSLSPQPQPQPQPRPQPRPRPRPQPHSPRVKQLRRSASAPFAVHRCFFGGEDAESAATTARLLARARLIVGLHPDEA